MASFSQGVLGGLHPPACNVHHLLVYLAECIPKPWHLTGTKPAAFRNVSACAVHALDTTELICRNLPPTPPHPDFRSPQLESDGVSSSGCPSL